MEIDEQDREQVDNERESRDARGRGRRQSKETTNAQTCDDMYVSVLLTDTRCDTLSHNVMCAQGQICRENLSCEVYLSTPFVGYSGSLSTVNETSCDKKRFEQLKKFVSSLPIPFRLVQPRCANAIVFVDLDGDALQVVLLIRGVNDFSSRQRL